MDYIFVTTWKLFLFFSNFFNKNVLTPFFLILNVWLHLYKIRKGIHSPRIESKMLWKHTKFLTTKQLQVFINKDEKVKVYYIWHEIVHEI
jgi:hypothetical protein